MRHSEPTVNIWSPSSEGSPLVINPLTPQTPLFYNPATPQSPLQSPSSPKSPFLFNQKNEPCALENTAMETGLGEMPPPRNVLPIKGFELFGVPTVNICSPRSDGSSSSNASTSQAPLLNPISPLSSLLHSSVTKISLPDSPKTVQSPQRINPLPQPTPESGPAALQDITRPCVNIWSPRTEGSPLVTNPSTPNPQQNLYKTNRPYNWFLKAS